MNTRPVNAGSMSPPHLTPNADVSESRPFSLRGYIAEEGWERYSPFLLNDESEEQPSLPPSNVARSRAQARKNYRPQRLFTQGNIPNNNVVENSGIQQHLMPEGSPRQLGPEGNANSSVELVRSTVNCMDNNSSDEFRREQNLLISADNERESPQQDEVRESDTMMREAEPEANEADGDLSPQHDEIRESGTMMREAEPEDNETNQTDEDLSPQHAGAPNKKPKKMRLLTEIFRQIDEELNTEKGSSSSPSNEQVVASKTPSINRGRGRKRKSAHVEKFESADMCETTRRHTRAEKNKQIVNAHLVKGKGVIIKEITEVDKTAKEVEQGREAIHVDGPSYSPMDSNPIGPPPPSYNSPSSSSGAVYSPMDNNPYNPAQQSYSFPSPLDDDECVGPPPGFEGRHWENENLKLELFFPFLED